jgi:acyl-CoA reductase-like NAD-dependent aldehyde dehydrogenase
VAAFGWPKSEMGYSPIKRLRAAVIDGRTTNLRYRQDELQHLHKSLLEDGSKLLVAIAADAQSSQTEAKLEYYFAIKALRECYESLDFQSAISDEYAVVNRKDNLARRLGVGVVVIRPARYSRFYSILSPIEAAVAADNCIVLEVSVLSLEAVSWSCQ